MSQPEHPLWLSAAGCIAGLSILHFASWLVPGRPRELGCLRSSAFALAGALMASPFGIWVWWTVSHPKLATDPAPARLFLLVGYMSVSFLWFIWNVTSYALELRGVDASPWDENWGATYSPALKKRILGDLFAQLEKLNGIGDLIVDVGSGASPTSKFMDARPGRKFIFIDIAAVNSISANEQHLRFDAAKINHPASAGYRRALIRVCRFLKLNPRAKGSTGSADMMIFSDLLNYVDFREVLGGFARFLKPGGRFVIINLPCRGIRSLFSEKGLKNNYELYEYLEGHGFAIEHKEFPAMPATAMDEAEEMIVLIACKQDESFKC